MLSRFDYLAHGLRGKTFFCELALALQRQFERVRNAFNCRGPTLFSL